MNYLAQQLETEKFVYSPSWVHIGSFDQMAFLQDYKNKNKNNSS